MKDKWNDIVNDHSTDLNEIMLLDYLEGKLNEEETHHVEKMMADSAFVNDAVEGLSGMKDKQKIATVLQQLNAQLPSNKNRKKKQFNQLIPNQQTLTIASIVMILLLVVIAFVIFKMMQA